MTSCFPAPRAKPCSAGTALSLLGLLSFSAPATTHASSPSQELGRALATEVRASCPSSKPYVVGVRAYGTLPDWFSQEALEGALVGELGTASQVGTNGSQYFDTTQVARSRAALAPLFGAVFLVEIAPAPQRVDASLAGWCVFEDGLQTEIELVVRSAKEPRTEALPPALASAPPAAHTPLPPPPSPKATTKAAPKGRPIATIVAGELVAGTLIWKGMQRVSDSAQTAAQTGVQPHRQAMQGYGMQLLGVTMGFSLPPIVISRQRGD